MKHFLGLGILAVVGILACGDDSSPVLGDSGRADGGGADGGGDDGGADDGGADDGGADDGGMDAAMDDASADAAVDWPEGCGDPEPEWTALTVGEPGTCDALTACGGDIVGTWNLSGGCFEVAIMDALADCPGANVTRREGRGRGCVAFGADGQAHRVAQSEVEVDLFVPALCAGFVSCSTIESQIRLVGVEATCPEDDEGNCNCTASLDTAIDDRDGYTTEGDEIVGTTSGKRWEYCVEGDTLTYRDTSGSGVLEPGIIELTRR